MEHGRPHRVLLKWATCVIWNTFFGAALEATSPILISRRERVPHRSDIAVVSDGFCDATPVALSADFARVIVGLMTKLRPLVGLIAIGLLFMLGAGLPRSAAAQAGIDHISHLGSGDSVSIQVSGQPEVTTVYVGDDGTISVPLVGNIPVAGVSPVEAAARVAKALKDGGFFVDPHVMIQVTQSRSQLVSVVGEVGNAGRFPITPRTTVMELLAQAGGVKESASEVGYVLRSDENGHINRYPIKLNGLADLRDVLPTPTLLGGDSLVVPRAEHYFVSGEVMTPGKFTIEPGMTVIQAIARAGGVNERGSERRIQVKRLGKDGQYQVVQSKPSDPIQADDIIRVKESIF
jgi:polysaccharide export outer membrane protein